jgi:2Fe-2S ferredoxin
MPRATYIGADGRRHAIEVPVGASLMRAAVDAGISGIVGMCGGVMSCATCHVYVDAAFAGRVPPPSPQESGMLECTASPRKANSRLSCQINMTDDLDEITVTMAEPQA